MPITPPPTPWEFPPTDVFGPDDLVALGADLEPGTLLAAYRRGLFPMPYARRRLGWWSPDPRGILPLDGLTVSRSLRKACARFEIRIDTSFETVMRACSRPGLDTSWIDDSFVEAYTRLHELGWAHSVETWREGRLVGGLYGVRIDGLFAGESMFHEETDASKVALVALVEWLRDSGATLLDTQWSTPHLASLGVIDVPREEYLRRLDEALRPVSG
ncbi:MAG: Leucyl/phenylalanyl-tRNA--protein transferase [Actinomycetota bacterium]